MMEWNGRGRGRKGVKEAEDARNRENKRAEEQERGKDAGAGGDLLKNGVVKHSTHIVSRLRAYLSTSGTHIHRLLSTLSAGIFYPEMSIFNFREIFIPPPSPVDFSRTNARKKTRDA